MAQTPLPPAPVEGHVREGRLGFLGEWWGTQGAPRNGPGGVRGGIGAVSGVSWEFLGGPGWVRPGEIVGDFWDVFGGPGGFWVWVLGGGLVRSWGSPGGGGSWGNFVQSWGLPGVCFCLSLSSLRPQIFLVWFRYWFSHNLHRCSYLRLR